MRVTKESFEKLSDFEQESGLCLQCGGRLLVLSTGRSIWIKELGGRGGFGNVERVGVIYCQKCRPMEKAPEYGTPIYEDEFLEL